MFRIGLKFPCNGLTRVRKHGYTRLYLTSRYYETRARLKCETEGRLCKDVKLTSRFPGHKYSTATPRSEKTKGAGVLITLSAVTIGALGLLTFIKKNPEYRAALEGWVPGTDKVIRIVFQEDSDYLEFVRSFLNSIKHTLLSFISADSSEKQPAPKAAFESLVDKKDPPINEPYTEIRVSKEKGEDVEIVAEKPTASPPTTTPTMTTTTKVDSTAGTVPAPPTPSNLVELETLCGEAASKAIAAYKNAACAIRDYNEEVLKVVESANTAAVAANVWERLREATEKRKRAIQDAEKHAGNALDYLKSMQSLMEEPGIDAPAHVKTAARRNIKKILDDVDEAKKIYDEESRSGNISERYWKQVKAAREHFNEELQILFPNVNIEEKKFSVSEEAFDLFVLHMYNKVVSIEKELAKMQALSESKVRAALKATGEEANQEKLDALICLEVNREKRLLEEEFRKKLLEEQKKLDDELRRQLKLQAQVHNDYLREALRAKERETQRAVNRALSEQFENDSLKLKTQLATIVGRLRGLEVAFKARLEEEKGASNAQILWSACQALARAVKAVGGTSPPAAKPLEPEIRAISKAAPKEDPLVRAVIQGIPEEATKRGVYPEDALRERFLKVESVARRLAMVPEEGASLPIYLLSYLQSILIVRTTAVATGGPIPKNELDDEPIDVTSFDTYDILDRARYWLDRGNFKMSLRYMNLLKGAPRCIARDWMNEVRILLETQQAVDTLLAYAGATGLVFLEPSSKSTQN